MKNSSWNDSLSNSTDEQALRLGNIMSIYVLPVIVFSGLAFNAISCLVFTSQDLRKLSSSIYIFALLVSDSGVLTVLLFIWLEAIGFTVNHLNGVCQGFVFFTYVFSCLSVCFIVCITVENYITVCHPTTFNTMCTKRRAIYVVSSIIIVAFVLYIPSAVASEVRVFTFREGDAPRCSMRLDMMKMIYVLTYVDSVITLLIPLIAISALLIAVVLSIVQRTRWKEHLNNFSLLDASHMRTMAERRRSLSRSSPQVKVAKMLFALSLSYVIMNAPSHVTRLYYLIRPTTYEDDPTLTYTEGLIQLILQYVSYGYHAIKFFIFLLFSKNFVKNLKLVLSGLIQCKSICS